MPTNRITMRRIRETLRLHLQAGLSYNEVAQALKISKSVMGMVLTAHKTLVMFMRYVHTEDKPVREAAELVANRRKTITGMQRAKEAAA
jgi:hypothetical protein